MPPRELTTDVAQPSGGFRTDVESAAEECTAFLRSAVASADAEGVVIALSGGLDSTVTAALAVEALGANAVYGLVLPGTKFGGCSARDAETVAELLGIASDTVHVQPLLAHLGDLAPEHVDLHGNPVVRGNLLARVRATFDLAANDMERLVAGTTNRSELLLGYFTEYGDGAADVLPLGDCYKTEVRRLGRDLGVPGFVLEEQPSADFWLGQTDAGDLGAPYAAVDAVLHRYVDAGLDREAVQAVLDVDPDVVARVLRRHEETAHKRSRPPTPAEWERA